MSTCSDCKYWLKGTYRRYAGDPELILIPSVDEPNKAVCDIGPLKGNPTPADFGCNLFQPGAEVDHYIYEEYDKEPWEIWELGDCPNCRPPGVSGEAACHRCAGTGKVPYYRDGYIGEQQTWEHPIAKERRVAAERAARLAQLQAEISALS